MRQLEDNDVLHAQVLVYPLHALGSCCVSVDVVMMVEQPIHDIPLEALQQIHLGLEFLRVAIQSM